MINAMNAQIGSKKDLERKDWIFEYKLDGFRALLHVNKKIKFISRNMKDFTSKYPELSGIRKFINAKSCVLDGEIVSYNKKGVPDFTLLKTLHSANYIVFDILEKDGKSLIGLPLIQRKKILEETVKDNLKISKIAYSNQSKKLYVRAKKLGYEGLIAKDPTSRYYPGLRTKAWIKIKFLNTIDAVIVGYTSDRRYISSLVLALYNGNKELHLIGRVGTGFSDEEISELYEKFEKLRTDKKPVVENIKGKLIYWLKPKLVAEVKFLEFHKSLRHPSFIRLRAASDKKASQCTFDQIP